MLVLIGSCAMNMHLSPLRSPADMDIVGTYDEVQNLVKTLKSKGEKVIANYPINSGKTVYIKTDKRILEAEIAWEDSRAERLVKFVEGDCVSIVWGLPGISMWLPSLNFLYMLKMSHRYLKDSPHFYKTMKDIHFMRRNGAKIPEHMQEFYEQRMKDTYTYSHPKLNQTKDKFFDNATSIYTIDHDSIHEAVKHIERPAYEYFKDDAAEVLCSKDMFFACSERVRLLAGLEEAYVLSIERAIHPYNLVGEDREVAFETALMKLCTSISSGWFREFCWENHHQIDAMYNAEYVDKFYDALHNERILPFKGEPHVSSNRFS